MKKDLKEFAENWYSDDGYPDHDLINRLDLRPIADEIRKVVAHLSSEEGRIQAEDESKQAKRQRRSDKEPKITYRLRRVAPFSYHRDPVDCWYPFEGKVYYRSDELEWTHRVVAGMIEVHADNRAGVPGMNLIGPNFSSVPPMRPQGCKCPVDATVVATERWASEINVGGSGYFASGWTLEIVPAA